MANILSKLAKDLGGDISSYNKGIWKLFYTEMTASLGSMTKYMFTDEKQVSMLRRNLVYMQNALKEISQNEHHYHYYKEEDVDLKKPTLINPNNDKRESVGKIQIIGDELSDKNVLTNIFYTGQGLASVDSDAPDLANGEARYIPQVTTNSAKTLVEKTASLFQEHAKKEKSDDANAMWSLISRFGTHADNGLEDNDKTKIINNSGSAISKYGYSRGRNLLKKEVTKNGDFTDPYCRVWTWHKQYSKVSDLIRPMGLDNNPQQQLHDNHGWSAFRNTNPLNVDGNGSERLGKYGVMYQNGDFNGYVNITPKKLGDNLRLDVKNCMFSIENLAWKGMFNDYSDEINSFGLSREQKGPLGGRIMWFPPYNLEFNESVNANWEKNNFIGRGEPIFTYSNTTRSGNLSFNMVIDHPAILDYWNGGGCDNSDGKNVDNINSEEQTLLRFFAGCEVLSVDKNKEETTQTTPTTSTQDPSPDPTDQVIQFMVFFPNNYSGKDDRADGSIVDPIKYLYNGVGTQKQWKNNQIVDFEVSDNEYKIQGTNTVVGGYEMRDTLGISTVTTATTNNTIGYVTSSDKKYRLAKMVGTKADKKEFDSKAEWHKYRYYYRADKDTLNQKLVGDGATSYIDTASHKYNSTGFTHAKSKLGFRDTTYSFEDFYNVIVNGNVNTDDRRIISNVLSGETITSINCKGFASSQGNNKNNATNEKRNETLAQERANTVKNWLEKSKYSKNFSGKLQATTFGIQKEPTKNPKDSNDDSAKLHRFVLVEIHYSSSANEASVTTSTNTEDSTPQNSITSVNLGGRYDNEYKFFQALTKNSPLIAREIKDRIKNFDPVFHSMTPEGFNARLTFLQQCMRQGPTISGSDTQGLNANNLAFGRAPVCVLRVGDFFYTKIIIETLQISYEPLVWDLNQEGIGVMPMIAKIQMGFNFIGGQDLAGPIQRLQNATSFNYYANAGVYDNRVDTIKYGELGKVDDFYTPLTK